MCQFPFMQSGYHRSPKILNRNFQKATFPFHKPPSFFPDALHSERVAARPFEPSGFGRLETEIMAAKGILRRPHTYMPFRLFQEYMGLRIP